MNAHEIALGSAWILVAVYVLALVLDMGGAGLSARRRIWTWGAVVLSAHVLWAIFGVHQGSLSKAFDHTAEQTKAQVGLAIGAGLYVNFAMVMIWLADVAAWWSIPNWDQVRQKYYWPMQLVFGFLFINAAIVFATGWGRLVGATAILALLAAAIYFRKSPVKATSGSKTD